MRKNWTLKEIENEIRKNKFHSMKKMLDFALSEKYKIKKGSGLKVSFSIQTSDKYNKNRSLANIYPEKLEIPGNLYNQHRYLGLEEKEVDSYFKTFINISKKDMVQETKSGTLRIDIEEIDEELLFGMQKIIKSFIKKRKFYS